MTLKIPKPRNENDIVAWASNVPLTIHPWPNNLRNVNRIRHRYTNYEHLIHVIDQIKLPTSKRASAYWVIKERINNKITSILYDPFRNMI